MYRYLPRDTDPCVTKLSRGKISHFNFKNEKHVFVNNYSIISTYG